jgi:glycosyltransferase involved in cell wall biosynthesis
LGVPVVSTDCPSGPREILGDMDNLVQVGDWIGLSEAIKKILKKSANLLHYDTTHFTIDYATNQYIALLEEVK